MKATAPSLPASAGTSIRKPGDPARRWQILLGVLLVAAASGCGPRDEPAPPEETGLPPKSGDFTEEATGEGEPMGGVSPEVAAQSHARRAALHLGSTLKKRLTEVLGKEGPAAAVRVCSVEAAAIVSELEAGGRLRVGRSSLRLRNPRNVAPDWVAGWLRQQGERPVEGVEGISGEAGPARFLAPIGVEPICLNCHGPAASIPPDVRAALDELYPDDRAAGYAVGDLRGALWAESLAF